ncbi:hypothetical protein AB0O34_25970 [Sphaerisporangium sp. NPDC088356]|uniref:hypothetical protein n=1 Tax=Sphaerisporangium sp. NPDC088356 TaxID=3154871 RepID=UPI003440D16B
MGDDAEAAAASTPPDAASTRAAAKNSGRGMRQRGPPGSVDSSSFGLSGFGGVTMSSNWLDLIELAPKQRRHDRSRSLARSNDDHPRPLSPAPMVRGSVPAFSAPKQTNLPIKVTKGGF